MFVTGIYVSHMWGLLIPDTQLEWKLIINLSIIMCGSDWQTVYNLTNKPCNKPCNKHEILTRYIEQHYRGRMTKLK